jgi:hypothetical protein
LDFPAPALLAYPRETSVAEKFQAAVMLGMLNPRLKDFWDLWVISRQFAFQGPVLFQAIRATFDRRKTAIPKQPPVALTAEFGGNQAKQKDWQAFLKRHKWEGQGVGLEQVVAFLHGFLWPPARALHPGESFEQVWPASGPWTPASAE